MSSKPTGSVASDPTSSPGDKQHRPSKTAKTGAVKTTLGDDVNAPSSDVNMSESVPAVSDGKPSPVPRTGGDKDKTRDPEEVDDCPMDDLDSAVKVDSPSPDVFPAPGKHEVDEKTDDAGVRFGKDELHSYNASSAPSGSNVTPEKEDGNTNNKPSSSASASASQKGNDFDVTVDDDAVFTVSNIAPDDANTVRLALGCKPKSRHPMGLFVTLRLRLETPKNVHRSKHPAEYRAYVCSGVSQILKALQSIDKSAAFLHVYSDHDGIAPAFDDPEKTLSWTELTQTYGHASNQWIFHRSSFKSEQGGKGKSMSKHQRRKKRKAAKRNAEKSAKRDATADDDVGQEGTYDDYDGPGNLWLTLRLTTELSEDYVLNNARSALDDDKGIYIKNCQELHTRAEYALIMIHKSLCLTAVTKVLIEALQVQEQSMFKYQGLNRKFLREEVDESTGEVVLSQDPMPPLTLRWSQPPPLKSSKQGGKQHVISAEDRQLGSIVLLEASPDALVRLSTIIAQLRGNDAFQMLLGHKASFLDIGTRLPSFDNLSEMSTWKTNVQCNRGFNIMYDSITIPGLNNPYVNLKIQLSDPSQRSTRRSTNLRRVLTSTLVPSTWNDSVAHLACQVCPVLNSRNGAYGSTTIVYSGASPERQLIFANMAAHPVTWFYGFLTKECGYHPDMVHSLLKRSFTDSAHDIIMADEEGDWDSESWTVSTAVTRTQSQHLEQNLAENLHLDVSELLKTRRAVDESAARAALFRHKGMHPDSDVRTGHQTNDEYSRGTGVQYDASTVHSEQTNTFNENRQKKYAAAKLKLAENTAEMATKDRKIEDQEKLIAKLLQRFGKLDENDILSDSESEESDSADDDDDNEQSDDDTSTSEEEDESNDFSDASDSQMDLCIDLCNTEEDNDDNDSNQES